MNVSPQDIIIRQEQYQDLLRQAATERLIAQEDLSREPSIGVDLQQLAQRTLCRLTPFEGARICALPA